MIVAYTIAGLLVAGVAAGALASAWHHAHRHVVTDLRHRQLDAEVARHGVTDPRPTLGEYLADTHDGYEGGWP